MLILADTHFWALLEFIVIIRKRKELNSGHNLNSTAEVQVFHLLSCQFENKKFKYKINKNKCLMEVFMTIIHHYKIY